MFTGVPACVGAPAAGVVAMMVPTAAALAAAVTAPRVRPAAVRRNVAALCCAPIRFGTVVASPGKDSSHGAVIRVVPALVTSQSPSPLTSLNVTAVAADVERATQRPSRLEEYHQPAPEARNVSSAWSPSKSHGAPSER